MMRTAVRLTLWAAALALLAPVGTASAILLDEGIITRDTSNGLEWLDLTQSQNRSYNDVKTQFGAGGDFDGFRYATAAEVDVLWSRVGITVQGFQNPGLFSSASALMDLVGRLQATPVGGGTRFTNNGLTGGPFPGDATSRVGRTLEEYRNVGALGNAGSAIGTQLSNSLVNISVGSWLVKGSVPTGNTQGNPFLPAGGAPFQFGSASGAGFWFDPVGATAYDYQTDGLSSFTMVGVPTGLGDSDGMYTIEDATNGVVVVAEGAFHMFPTPVMSFTIRGIDPALDPTDPTAFPTFLQFDQTMVSFSMNPVPEPGTAVLLALGIMVLAARSSSAYAVPSATSRR